VAKPVTKPSAKPVKPVVSAAPAAPKAKAVKEKKVKVVRDSFTIPKAEEASAAKVFDLARQDVAGFDAYARKIRAMFKPSDRDVLIDLMEGLFHIAVADRTFHPAEEAFLRNVAQIFGLDDPCFRSLRARHVQDDPYAVLGVDPSAPDAAVRKAWREAVKASHPDVMLARGVPAEAVKLAQDRLRALNAAWEEISKARA
jgi:DnaJ like chaperone protein